MTDLYSQKRKPNKFTGTVPTTTIKEHYAGRIYRLRDYGRDASRVEATS